MIDDGEFGRIPYSKMKKYNKKTLRKSYKIFFESAEAYGLKWYKTNVRWYNKKKDWFNKGWEIRNGKWKLCHDFGYDFIFDKTKLTQTNLHWKKYFQKRTSFMNNIKIEKLCSDKWETKKMFSKITPKTFLIHNKTQLKQKLKYIKSNKIVLKPRFGSSAQDLIITTKNKLPLKIKKIQFYRNSNNVIKTEDCLNLDIMFMIFVLLCVVAK